MVKIIVQYMKDLNLMKFAQYTSFTFDDVGDSVFTVKNLKSFVCLKLM
jgi:hypothetical protein